MGFKRFVVGLCIWLTACGGGFSTVKTVASKVTVTDETLTPDHAMTIQPHAHDGSTRKLSPIEIGYLALEEPRFEKGDDGDVRLEANLLLKDRRSVLTQEHVVLTGTWDDGDEHPVLFPENDDDGDSPVRARLTCLEGKSGPGCERVLIDVFFKYKGQIHATQFEAQMNPHPDSDIPYQEEEEEDSAANPSEQTPSTTTTTATTIGTETPGDVAVANTPRTETTTPAAPIVRPSVTPAAQATPSTASVTVTAPPKQAPVTAGAKTASSAQTTTSPSPAKPAIAPAAKPTVSTPTASTSSTAAPAPATSAKPAVRPAPAAPAKPAPRTSVAPTKMTPQVSNDDEEEDESEGVDPADHPSIYVGTLYEGADDLMKMKRPPRKAKPAPAQPTKKPEATRPARSEPAPSHTEPAPSRSQPTPAQPTRPAPSTPAPAPATPKPASPSTMLPRGNYVPTPPQRPADLSTTTPAVPSHPSTSSTAPRTLPSTTTNGARPTDQAIGEPDEGYLERASSLRDHGGPFTLLQPVRERYYGTYELVDTVAGLARLCQSQPSMGPLRVGDLSQKHGGRLANSAHRSHQNGLDADLGYPVDPAYRERGFAPMVNNGVVSPALHLGETWSLFRSVWATHRMDRIFVDGHIKAALCSVAQRNGDAQTSEGRELLRHLRPTPGHHNHFHLRIRCSTYHPRCRMMGEPPAGSGC